MKPKAKSRGGRPWLPVPNSPSGRCGRKAALEEEEAHLNAGIIWVVAAGDIEKSASLISARL